MAAIRPLSLVGLTAFGIYMLGYALSGTLEDKPNYQAVQAHAAIAICWLLLAILIRPKE